MVPLAVSMSSCITELQACLEQVVSCSAAILWIGAGCGQDKSAYGLGSGTLRGRGSSPPDQFLSVDGINFQSDFLGTQQRDPENKHLHPSPRGSMLRESWSRQKIEDGGFGTPYFGSTYTKVRRLAKSHHRHHHGSVLLLASAWRTTHLPSILTAIAARQA